MSAAKNNITAPDVFNEEGLLLCLDSVRVRLQVANQAIYWRRGFAQPGGSGIFWEPEEFQAPNVVSFNDRCDYVQVRAAVPAAKLPPGALQAQVTITTRTEGDMTGKPGS